MLVCDMFTQNLLHLQPTVTTQKTGGHKVVPCGHQSAAYCFGRKEVIGAVQRLHCKHSGHQMTNHIHTLAIGQPLQTTCDRLVISEGLI